MGGIFVLHNRTTENLATEVVPERELLLAVLDRCVLDFHGANLKLKVAAKEWLFEEEPNDSGREFSFPWICEFLGLEKERLRECIRALDLSGKAPQGHRWLRKKVKSVDTALVA